MKVMAVVTGEMNLKSNKQEYTSSVYTCYSYGQSWFCRIFSDTRNKNDKKMYDKSRSPAIVECYRKLRLDFILVRAAFVHSIF